MRSAGNFHPEWGYLAPAPSFVRTLRVVLVATAIGATAGAAVVVSLLARPASGSADSSIAAHALVTGAPAANSDSAAVAAPQAAQASPAAAQALPAAAPAKVAALPAQPVAANPPQAGGSGESAATSGNPNNAAPAPQIANGSQPAGAAPTQAGPIGEPAAAPANDDGAVAPESGANKKPAAKKHRVAGYEAIRRWQGKKPRRNGGGFEPLFRLFSARGGPFSTY